MNEPRAIITLLVLGVTGYVSYRGFGSAQFVEAYIFCPVRILRDKQYHRLVTSGFLHADWMHLLFNMFSLYSFGRNIELIYGRHEFLLIYFSAILGGSVLSLYLHRHHDYRALGASGGVCGIIFASIFLLPGGGVEFILLPISIPAWLYAILFILISFSGMRSQSSNIGHDAHLGGALVGLAVATLLHPQIITHCPVLYPTVVVVSVALLVYAYRLPFNRQTSCPSTRQHWQRVWTKAKTKAAERSRQSDEETLDRLLDKISQSGMQSLSRSERAKLTAISKRRNR